MLPAASNLPDLETKGAAGFRLRDQFVAALIAEMGDVDNCRRVRCDHVDNIARRQHHEALAQFQHRQRAEKSGRIEFRNFRHGVDMAGNVRQGLVRRIASIYRRCMTR